MRVNSDIGRVNIPDQGDHPEELTSHFPRWACSLGPERFGMQRSPRAVRARGEGRCHSSHGGTFLKKCLVNTFSVSGAISESTRNVNHYVKGAHERTRQRSTPLYLIHTTRWRAGQKTNGYRWGQTHEICEAEEPFRDSSPPLPPFLGRMFRSTACVGAHGGHQRIVFILCMLNAFPARACRS